MNTLQLWISTHLDRYPTNAAAGRALGVTGVLVGAWRTGQRIPGARARDALIGALNLTSAEADRLRRLCDAADRDRRGALGAA